MKMFKLMIALALVAGLTVMAGCSGAKSGSNAPDKPVKPTVQEDATAPAPAPADGAAPAAPAAQ